MLEQSSLFSAEQCSKHEVLQCKLAAILIHQVNQVNSILLEAEDVAQWDEAIKINKYVY